MGKILIIAGVVFLIAGLAIEFLGRFQWPGKLPGDIYIDKGNFKVYIPIATSILVSIILSLLFFLFNRFKNQ